MPRESHQEQESEHPFTIKVQVTYDDNDDLGEPYDGDLQFQVVLLSDRDYKTQHTLGFYLCLNSWRVTCDCKGYDNGGVCKHISTVLRGDPEQLLRLLVDPEESDDLAAMLEPLQQTDIPTAFRRYNEDQEEIEEQTKRLRAQAHASKRQLAEVLNRAPIKGP